MDSSFGFDTHWYAVQTRSRHEKTASAQLRAMQIQNFLPLQTIVRRWENDTRQVQLPLFPGYVFVRLALKDRLDVLRVHGVARFVGFGGIPVAIADCEIQQLQKAVGSGMKTRPYPYLSTGQRIRVSAGPLAGYEGVLLKRKGIHRLVLSIQTIQRSVIIDIDAREVEQE